MVFGQLEIRNGARRTVAPTSTPFTGFVVRVNNQSIVHFSQKTGLWMNGYKQEQTFFAQNMAYSCFFFSLEMKSNRRAPSC